MDGDTLRAEAVESHTYQKQRVHVMHGVLPARPQVCKCDHHNLIMPTYQIACRPKPSLEVATFGAIYFIISLSQLYTSIHGRTHDYRVLPSVLPLLCWWQHAHLVPEHTSCRLNVNSWQIFLCNMRRPGWFGCLREDPPFSKGKVGLVRQKS